MARPHLLSGSDFHVRPFASGDEAAMFTISATWDAADAGELVSWITRLEDSLEAGGAAWVAARGKRVGGYAIATPVPGLPGVFDLAGGVSTPWRRRGLGTRLLDAAKGEAQEYGARQLSCHTVDLDHETSRFLLARGFAVEHEECLLEVDLARDLPPPVSMPELTLRTLTRERAVALFSHVYDQAFAGRPWSQPYTAAETDALLGDAADLLFAMRGDEPVGVAWIEMNAPDRGRIEPLGVVADHQGRGYGRWLLRSALAELRGRGARVVEVGLWRANTAASNLYKGAGFTEIANWYYLACDLSSD